MRAAAVHRQVHLGALAGALIMLPWSEFLLSNALIVLFGNRLWQAIAERRVKETIRHAFQDPATAVWLSFFGLHLLGLLWTTDLAWGLDLCRILLPIPILGLVLSTTERLRTAELRWMLLLGAWSVVASTMACLVLRYEVLGTADHRDLSPFISHIRLALMVCFAIATLLYYRPRHIAVWVMHLAAVAWCIRFLFLLGSLSGLLALALLALWAALRFLWRRGGAVRMAVPVVLLGLGACAWLMVRAATSPAHGGPTVQLDRLDSLSAGGERYYHDRIRPQQENGHPVWVYIADGELERGWERRSDIGFHSTDRAGGPLRTTLVRYLASQGLRKDSVGLQALTAEDVHRIEDGITSVRTGRDPYLLVRAEQLRHEWDTYRSAGVGDGHSATMRLEYQRVGLHIARAHPWTGVGTGDTRPAFAEAYDELQSPLGQTWRLRAHQQYLTWLISFGWPGLLWCLVAWCWPARRHHAGRWPLFVAWAIIAATSGLTEDTLETQMGATFAALYFSLFVWAAPVLPRSTPGPAPVGSA